MHIYNYNAFERETHIGYAYILMIQDTYIASYQVSSARTSEQSKYLMGEEDMSFVLTHERRGRARQTHSEVVEHQTSQR